MEKEGKPHGKNPPPKREMKMDALMDGVIKIPPIMTYIQYIQERNWRIIMTRFISSGDVVDTMCLISVLTLVLST